MKKEMSKFLCCLLILLTFALASTETASATSTKEVTTENSSTHIANVEENGESIEVAPMATQYWRTVLKIAFKKVIGSVTSPFNYAPETSFGATRDTANMGSVKFNDGSGGFNTVVKDVYAEKVGHQIEMWGNSQQLLYTGKIGVVLRAPNGTFRINRTVGHNQYSWYKIPAGGTGLYQAQYNTTSKDKWRLWVGYYHWGNSSSAMTYNIINEDSSIAKYDFTDIDGKRYLIPSTEYTKATNALTSGNQTNSPISFPELYEQFYDSKHKSLVDVAKNYKAGETIYISDLISDIYYNEKDNKTEFFFANQDEFVEVHFEGDLTERFTVGDNVNFKFELISLSEKNDFVIIDYNKMVEENDNVPKIDQFLVK